MTLSDLQRRRSFEINGNLARGSIVELLVAGEWVRVTHAVPEDHQIVLWLDGALERRIGTESNDTYSLRTTPRGWKERVL